MAIIRSPNYPSMSLPEAISRVAVVHEKEQHIAAPREVVAAHMGFKSLNGSSLKALSALLKYGLLEKVAGDQRRVTNLAVRILHPTDEADKRAAIVEAANHPSLFKEIAKQWPSGTPSDANLKAWLIRRQFAADAVSDVIKAYRETMALVAQEGGTYDSGVTTLQTMGTPESHSMLVAEAAPAVALPPFNSGLSADPFRVTLSPSGGMEGAFRLNNAADLDALVRVLQGMKFVFKMAADIKEAGGPKPGTPYPDDDEDAN